MGQKGETEQPSENILKGVLASSFLGSEGLPPPFRSLPGGFHGHKGQSPVTRTQPSCTYILAHFCCYSGGWGRSQSRDPHVTSDEIPDSACVLGGHLAYWPVSPKRRRCCHQPGGDGGDHARGSSSCSPCRRHSQVGRGRCPLVLLWEPFCSGKEKKHFCPRGTARYPVHRSPLKLGAPGAPLGCLYRHVCGQRAVPGGSPPVQGPCPCVPGDAGPWTCLLHGQATSELATSSGG